MNYFRRAIFLVASLFAIVSIGVPAAFAQEASPTTGQNGTTLSETMTLDGTYQTLFGWTIQKSVTPSTWNIFVSDTGTSNYTVTLTKDGGTTTAVLSGQVCITNGGSVDTVGLASNLEVSMPPSQTIIQHEPLDVSGMPILAAGASHCYPYSITLSSPVVPGATYKVKADTTITDHSGHLGIPFGPNEATTTDISGTPTLVNDTVHVTDTNGQSWTESSGATEHYSKTFSCSAVGDTTYPNTATITETNQNSSAGVVVHCFDPTVTKTATTTFNRQYFWNIHKTGDQSNLTLALGETFPVNYTVTVSDTVTDSNWGAEGEIVIHNPAPIPAKLNSLTDLPSGAVPGVVTCPVTFPYVLAANSDLICSYTSVLPNATDRVNTATLIQQNFHYDAQNNPTPTGTTTYTGTAPITFTGTQPFETDKCITVSDNLTGISLGQVCVGKDTLPKTFTYTYTIPGATTCGPRTISNTASFVSSDTPNTGSSTWNVTVNTPCKAGCTLTIGYWKNHAGFTKQPNKIQPGWLPIWLGQPHTFPSLDVADNATASAVLSQNVFGAPSNGITKLYSQLLAADFNQLNGASVTAITTTLNDANTFLGLHFWPDWPILSKADQQKVLSYQSTLDSYNNGLIGPGHCSQ
jgi:hypothetical protein